MAVSQICQKLERTVHRDFNVRAFDHEKKQLAIVFESPIDHVESRLRVFVSERISGLGSWSVVSKQTQLAIACYVSVAYLLFN